MSEQKQDLEKVKVPIEESKVPEEEWFDITNENPDQQMNNWTKSENSDFWNAPVSKVLEKITPKFITIVRSIAFDPQYKDKKLQITFRGFMFGWKKMNNMDFMWRLKMGQGGSGSDGQGGSNFKQSFPLDEVFVGTAQQVNKKIAEDANKRWYLVGNPQIVINPNITDANAPNFAQEFITIKRNKRPPTEEKT